jgi:DNA-binding MarR family transcriptional regulator
VHHLAAAIGEMDAAIGRRLGLTASDYIALKHLVVSEAPLGPVELGRMLGITSGAATGLVDRLESAGYARRGPHPHDRRRRVVTATAQARRRMRAALQPLATDIDRVEANLTGEQRRAVAGLLTRLADLHRRHVR